MKFYKTATNDIQTNDISFTKHFRSNNIKINKFIILKVLYVILELALISVSWFFFIKCIKFGI